MVSINLDLESHGPPRHQRPRLRQFLSLRPSRLILRLLFIILIVILVLELWPSHTTKPAAIDESRIFDGVDWSQFAYAQYVTNLQYLCNSVMIFEALHRLGSRADRLMMYPSFFHPNGDDEEREETLEGKLLLKAQRDYNVTLVPIEVQHKEENGTQVTWADSYTKLLAFNQTQYQRILSLDSDATVLKSMDELFLLPPSPVAMPRAYWMNPADHVLTSLLVLIQPSEMEVGRINAAIEASTANNYDMEIINSLYSDNAMVLPHRQYALLTGEFRRKTHKQYLGNDVEEFNPRKVLKEAKFLHFSDWPVPKPWIIPRDEVLDANQPPCVQDPVNGEVDCTAQEIWLEFYHDFGKRRKNICGMKVYQVTETLN